MNSITLIAMVTDLFTPTDATRTWMLCLSLMVTFVGSADSGCFANQDVRAAESGVAQDSDAAGASGVAGSVSDTPWYDVQQKRVRPIPLHPRQDDSVHRDSRWLPKAKTIPGREPIDGTNPTTGGNAPTNGLFGSSLTLGNIFGWVLLAATVMAVVGIIVYGVSRAELSMAAPRVSSSTESAASGLPDEQTMERIKHLPPELRRTDVNLRSECERLMKEGCFDQAIILLLGHQLLLLDSNGLLRLSRGKTNGRYVRETQTSDEPCAAWLRQTADAFEQSYFGRHEITAEAFAQIWRQNEMLESSVRSFGVAK